MRLLVLGDPIEHSLSPLLQTTALRAAGLTGTYDRRRVDAAGMAAAVDEIRTGNLDGANVTMPHKELAASLCDRLGTGARRAQAVNTLVRSGIQVVGHNTDIAGIEMAWEEAGLPTDAPVLVLGAGGAAAAALLAAEGRELLIAARRMEAAEALVDRLGLSARIHPWAKPAVAVVVNATPIGMSGERLPQDVLGAAVGLFDMAYGAGRTPAVSWIADQGLPTANGRQMLLHQAAAAFELWTGHTAPVDAMAGALLRNGPPAES